MPVRARLKFFGIMGSAIVQHFVLQQFNGLQLVGLRLLTVGEGGG